MNEVIKEFETQSTVAKNSDEEKTQGNKNKYFCTFKLFFFN